MLNLEKTKCPLKKQKEMYDSKNDTFLLLFWISIFEKNILEKCPLYDQSTLNKQN
jgi:hypothetical protein